MDMWGFFTEQSAIIVFLVIGIYFLGRENIRLRGVITSKDDLIVGFATKSIDALKGVEMKGNINTAEHKEIKDDVGKLDDKINELGTKSTEILGKV